MLRKYYLTIRQYFNTNTDNKSQDEGIITLADENYFEGLINLYHSVQLSYPTPIICYDIGLTEKQKVWINEHLINLSIKTVPDIQMIRNIKSYQEKTQLGKKNKRQWALWICPFLIQDSPFTKTFWLDCDLIILRDLESLFLKLNEGPVFTPENLAPELTPNSPSLYKLLPPQNKQFDERKALINAGVSGWDLKRDKVVLNDYASIVKRAFEDEAIKKSISWHDQGALIWAILNNGLENRVEDTWKWNRCVKYTKARGLQFVWEDGSIISELRNRVPEANILHWNGQPVPWSNARINKDK